MSGGTGYRMISLTDPAAVELFRGETESTHAERVARFWRHLHRARREVAPLDARLIHLEQIAQEPDGPASYDGWVFND